jgi:hypothetical protein
VIKEMDIAASQSVQLSDKIAYGVIILIAATVVKLMDIHNEMIIIFNSLFLFIFFMFVKSAATTLPYASISKLLVKISDFAIFVFGFFTATILGNLVTGFLTSDGSITLRTSNKVVIFLILAITLALILPRHLAIADLDRRIEELKKNA